MLFDVKDTVLKGNENLMSSEDFNRHNVWNLSIDGYEFGKDKIMEDKFCETKKAWKFVVEFFYD